MSKDSFKQLKSDYDVVVVGSGLAGLTTANILGRAGYRVLLLEQHFKLGGLATWFQRRRCTFDVSLHGFPHGMIKSCRRYWSREIADSIVQLKNIRFDNPMFSLTTLYNRDDFTRLLVERFGIQPERVKAFFDTVRRMNFYDDQSLTTRELFERFFPGRDDVVRLLMEPITYANGSTLEDPAITYGIVFSNFMSKGVFTFEGGTDHLVKLMHRELLNNGVDVALRANVERIVVERGRVSGVQVGGRVINSPVVVSNANLLGTVGNLVGFEKFDRQFMEEVDRVRLNNSSTQVYMALKPGEYLDESTGDLLFSSVAPRFETDLLLNHNITSRTFSFYYPRIRPRSEPRCLIVSSTNARYEDWSQLVGEEYEASKQALIDSTLDVLDQYVPDCRQRIEYTEAATPKTFERYTKHLGGSSFGTKFEGLAVSRALPQQIRGLYHAGSVGIIMSGWLGAINYGVIVANDVDAMLTRAAERSGTSTLSHGEHSK